MDRGRQKAVAMTHLSCHRFRANEVRLWLSVLAYNLGNLWWRLALPKAISRWSLNQLAAAAGQDRREID
jgi:Transposase DDE domain group 1